MNKLSVEKQTLILSLLSEGNSIRSVARISGADRNTVTSLLVNAGERAQEILDREMTNLKLSNLQVDEIWTFVAKKQAMLTKEEKRNQELGDQYVFVALDADTKLIPAFRVGKRTGELARSFIVELQTRIMTRFQLSTDAFSGYSEAVDKVFGSDIDYGQIHKQYTDEQRNEHRYSPGNIIRITKRVLLGEPIQKNISTSYVERQNLTMRMQMRRFTRLTNAFSKKLDNLKAALALYFFHYNFMRIHQTLRATPAMEAGISKHLWTWEEFLGFGAQQSQAA
ncbi:MAG: IS1 family transposase [Bacteroidota bacterium]|jgi:IS1 family transposase